MRLEYNITGSERKAMVAVISTAINTQSRYLGAPSMAYKIGDFLVTRDGALEYGDVSEEILANVIMALETHGYVADQRKKEQESRLHIKMPREFFNDETLRNLENIIKSKQSLLKKAFDTDSVNVEVDDDHVLFPWFSVENASDAYAYGLFVEKLSIMARNAVRVTAKERPLEGMSEKYVFRCFLLRLGFIGAEYKEVRKILLRNLTGSAAFAKVARNE